MATGRTRASSRVLDRQSDAERDLLAQQQEGGDALEAATEADAAAGAAADTAANAVVSSCEVAQQVVQQLQELGPTAAAAFMVGI